MYRVAGLGLAPHGAEPADRFLGDIALGITAGAVTAVLLDPGKRQPAFRVLPGALVADAVIMGAMALKYGGL